MTRILNVFILLALMFAGGASLKADTESLKPITARLYFIFDNAPSMTGDPYKKANDAAVAIAYQLQNIQGIDLKEIFIQNNPRSLGIPISPAAFLADPPKVGIYNDASFTLKPTLDHLTGSRRRGENLPDLIYVIIISTLSASRENLDAVLVNNILNQPRHVIVNLIPVGSYSTGGKLSAPATLRFQELEALKPTTNNIAYEKRVAVVMPEKIPDYFSKSILGDFVFTHQNQIEAIQSKQDDLFNFEKDLAGRVETATETREKVRAAITTYTADRTAVRLTTASLREAVEKMLTFDAKDPNLLPVDIADKILNEALEISGRFEASNDLFKKLSLPGQRENEVRSFRCGDEALYQRYERDLADLEKVFSDGEKSGLILTGSRICNPARELLRQYRQALDDRKTLHDQLANLSIEIDSELAQWNGVLTGLETDRFELFIQQIISSKGPKALEKIDSFILDHPKKRQLRSVLEWEKNPRKFRFSKLWHGGDGEKTTETEISETKEITTPPPVVRLPKHLSDLTVQDSTGFVQRFVTQNTDTNIFYQIFGSDQKVYEINEEDVRILTQDGKPIFFWAPARQEDVLFIFEVDDKTVLAVHRIALDDLIQIAESLTALTPTQDLVADSVSEDGHYLYKELRVVWERLMKQYNKDASDPLYNFESPNWNYEKQHFRRISDQQNGLANFPEKLWPAILSIIFFTNDADALTSGSSMLIKGITGRTSLDGWTVTAQLCALAVEGYLISKLAKPRGFWPRPSTFLRVPFTLAFAYDSIKRIFLMLDGIDPGLSPLIAPFYNRSVSVNIFHRHTTPSSKDNKKRAAEFRALLLRLKQK